MAKDIYTQWHIELSGYTYSTHLSSNYCRELAFKEGINPIRNGAIRNFREVPRVQVFVYTANPKLELACDIAKAFPSVAFERDTRVISAWYSRTYTGFKLTGDMYVFPAFFWITKVARDGLWVESQHATSLAQRFLQTLELAKTRPLYPLYMMWYGRGPIDTLVDIRAGIYTEGNA